MSCAFPKTSQTRLGRCKSVGINVAEVWAGFRIVFWAILLAFTLPCTVSADDNSSNGTDEMELVRKLEQHRIAAINKVIGSVVAIYDDNRQGGGSGVIIDPTGIALTNHHVIMGAGISGWGGLDGGKLYRWKLIGTDPGGDVSIIQMIGKDDFPFTPLGDSDQVRVGDWALAMGNPFVLTEDQSPTITLGIVSGIKRYQPGAGANQLVYGNCIQVDSSINPGNSGGPLFNMDGQVIGINGRGSFSFQERGKVNVGLGYAISANQIKNFIPDLLATKLVEHATLDASFADRDGKVVCSQINLDAPVAMAGLRLKDELLEFEGIPIKNANQYTNLICTLPEDWPAALKIRKPDGTEKDIHVRVFGLPYQTPGPPKRKKQGGEEPSPEEKQQAKRQKEMIDMLSAPPGKVRFKDINRKYAAHVVKDWQQRDGKFGDAESNATVLKLVDDVLRNGEPVGRQVLWLSKDGRFRAQWDVEDEKQTYIYDGKQVFSSQNGESLAAMTLVEAKLSLPVIQAMGMLAAQSKRPFSGFGNAPEIDGSDKSNSQNAYRMRLLDSDADPFFFWLRMYGDDGLPAGRLIKVGADKDSKEGGVIFDDWTEDNGIVMPLRRDFVIGLNESRMESVVNQTHQWVEPDDGWFAVPDQSDEAEPTEAEIEESVAPESDSERANSEKANSEEADSKDAKSDGGQR